MKDLPQYLGPALAGIAVPLLLGWLLHSAKRTARKEDGVTWLDHSRAMKGLTLFFVGFMAAMMVASFVARSQDKGNILAMVALIGGLMVPMVIEVFFVRIGFDATRIYCHSGWRRNRVIDWSEVESVVFSSTMQWWVIQTTRHGKIRASAYMAGLDEFLAELDRRGIKPA